MNWTDPEPEEVADGVFRIALPLPNDGLKAVNVYALSGPDGLSLIDGGWALADSLGILAESLQQVGFELGEIEQCLVTHIHRDHYSQAVTLNREYGTRVSLGIAEKANLEQILDWHGRPAIESLSYLGRCGAMELLAKAMRGAPASDSSTWQRPDVWLEDGAKVQAGGRDLTVVHTPGHTAGHVVFHDEPAALLFAGDHVLPHITPSIGFEPIRPAFPLQDFLDSLRLMLTRPDARLLPAHGSVAPSVHARCEELLTHHADRLDATEAVVRAAAGNAYQVAQVLPWTRRNRRLAELDLFNAMLATSETSAHLDVLVMQGRLRSETVDGVEIYQAA